MANNLVNDLEKAGDEPLRASAAEKAAYEAGLKTAYSLNRMSSKVSLDYMTMAIVQDALRAYRQSIQPPAMSTEELIVLHDEISLSQV